MTQPIPVPMTYFDHPTPALILLATETTRWSEPMMKSGDSPKGTTLSSSNSATSTWNSGARPQNALPASTPPSPPSTPSVSALPRLARTACSLLSRSTMPPHGIKKVERGDVKLERTTTTMNTKLAVAHILAEKNETMRTKNMALKRLHRACYAQRHNVAPAKAHKSE